MNHDLKHCKSITLLVKAETIDSTVRRNGGVPIPAERSEYAAIVGELERRGQPRISRTTSRAATRSTNLSGPSMRGTVHDDSEALLLAEVYRLRLSFRSLYRISSRSLLDSANQDE